MEKITTVNPEKSVGRVHGDRAKLTAAELMSAIEKVRPVIDEDEEWYCAEELFARTDLSKDNLVKLMAYEPVLAGHIYALYLAKSSYADLYVLDWLASQEEKEN